MRIPDTLLLATCAFGAGLAAERVVAALAGGVRAAGMPEPDPCPLASTAQGDDLRRLLDSLDFDARMRRARAVIVGAERLQERTLAGSAACEIATRARQAGVPAYAVTGENHLTPFDARILDLQAILEAGNPRALVAAGRTLAGLV
jgi:glycerate kinase